MRDEFDKCHFCKYYDSFEGCINDFCSNHDGYKPNKSKLIEVAHQKKISVSDLISLIDLK